MERARRDEEDVIGPDRTVLRHDGRAFDDGQDVALHTFARDVRARTLPLDGDLVDLIEEYDAALFCHADGGFLDLLHVNELRGLFLLEEPARLRHGDLALLLLLRHEVRHHVLQIVAHALKAGACEHAGHRLARILDLDLDNLFFQLALRQTLPDPLAACRILRLLAFLCRLLVVCAAEEFSQMVLRLLRLRHEHVENALLGKLSGAFLHFLHALLAHHAHGCLREVAHNGLDVAPHIADLRELRRLDLDERRFDKLRQATRDLRLADARRTDHQDVLRYDVVLHRGVKPTAAPTIAKGDGDGALRFLLSDDIAVKFFHNLPRSLLVQQAFLPFDLFLQINPTPLP